MIDNKVLVGLTGTYHMSQTETSRRIKITRYVGTDAEEMAYFLVRFEDETRIMSFKSIRDYVRFDAAE